jgi:hypothetical protein
VSRLDFCTVEYVDASNENVVTHAVLTREEQEQMAADLAAHGLSGSIIPHIPPEGPGVLLEHANVTPPLLAKIISRCIQ